MKKLTTILALIILIALGAYLYFYFGTISSNSQNDQKIDFVIASGEGINQISSHLYEKKLIKNQLIFKAYLWQKKLQGDIKAGEYHLAQNLNIVNLVKILSEGQVKKDVDIKIIEGWTTDDIAEYLGKNNIVAKADFTKTITDVSKVITNNLKKYPFLSEILLRSNSEATLTLEGYLFPDTYTIYTTATSEDILEKMLANFDKKVDQEIRAEIKKQNKTLDEVLILASIIEKEVASYEERRMVADIFLKRLAVGMPLQSDATVNYVTKKKTTRPSYDDLEVDSLYNTYKNKGLPPTPINNPSLSAIKAVVYPIKNDYYFFLTDKNNVIHYGRNGEEHIMNRQKYLD
jgi:UPF0755 protein